MAKASPPSSLFSVTSVTTDGRELPEDWEQGNETRPPDGRSLQTPHCDRLEPSWMRNVVVGAGTMMDGRSFYNRASAALGTCRFRQAPLSGDPVQTAITALDG